MKHTPGPWKVGHNGMITASNGFKHIANVKGFDTVGSATDPDDPKADASLIEAAPALLEACKKMLSVLIICNGDNPNSIYKNGINPFYVMGATEAISEGKQAIAEAELIEERCPTCKKPLTEKEKKDRICYSCYGEEHNA